MLKILNMLKWPLIILVICGVAFWFGLRGGSRVKVKAAPEKVITKTTPEAKSKIVIHTKKKARLDEQARQAKKPVKKKTIAKPVKKTKKVAALGTVADPFKVDFPIRKKGATEEAVSLKTFVLQGIIVAGTKSVALIDDKVVGVGDYIYGWKVVGIKKDRIGLKRGRRIKRLYLSWGE